LCIGASPKPLLAYFPTPPDFVSALTLLHLLNQVVSIGCRAPQNQTIARL